jgi:hypothetical protein
MAGWWKRFVDNLAKASQKEYGSDVPDCCKMNKNAVGKTPNK